MVVERMQRENRGKEEAGKEEWLKKEYTKPIIIYPWKKMIKSLWFWSGVITGSILGAIVGWFIADWLVSILT